MIADGWHLWPAIPVKLSVALFAISATGYVLTATYFDHVEPAIASVSWVVVRGEESHPRPEAIGMYGFGYGPMLYLINGYVLELLGPSILTSKLAGALAALGSVAILAVAIARANPRGAWSCATGWTALLLMTFGASTFWVRAEPLLLFCSSLAILGLSLPPLGAILVVGLAVGIGVNLKLTAVIYLLPPLVFLWQQHRTAVLLGTVLVGAVVAVLPFAVYASISLTSYWYWIQATATHGIRPQSIITMLQWALFVLLPLVVFDRQSDRGFLFRAVLIGSVLVSVPLGAKYGSGPYHFVPFIPAVVFCAALVSGGGRGEARLSAAAFFLTCILLAAAQLHNWLHVTSRLPSATIVAELRSVESRYDGPMAVGYSSNYRVSFYRPILVFDGHPLVFDAAGMMDRHWTGDPFPLAAAFESFKECRIKTWLVPRGGAPFRFASAYPRDGPTVPDEFRQSFERRYTVVERGQWFDVWRCRDGG